MPQVRLFYLDSSRLVATRWSSGVLHEEARFVPDSQGLAAFAEYVGLHGKNSLFYLLANLAEEGFLLEALPYTQGSDRSALMARKLGQYFFGSALATAISYGREKEGRRDERILFTALTRPQVLEPWLTTMRSAEARLAGIYTVPLLGNALVSKLSPSGTRCLLVSITPAGIRQSYFENAQIKFSRLTSLTSLDPQDIADSCAAEAAQIYQYLLGQRLLSRGVPLPVIALVHPMHAEAFRQRCTNSEFLQVDIRDLHSIGTACGLKSLPGDSSSENLFLHLMAQSPPRDQLAPPEDRRFFRLWKMRAALYKAGAAALFGCLLYALLQTADVIGLRSAAAALRQDAETDQKRYAEVQSTFPPMPTSKENLRAVINGIETLERRSVPPEAMYLSISRALGEIPRVELERVQWHLGNNPDEGLPSSTDGRAGPAAGVTTDKDASAMYATAVIHGMLPASMLNDQRGQLDTVNAFAKALQKDTSLKVSIRRMPFDIESGKSLKSSAESVEAAGQPRFLIQVVRKL